MKHPYVGKPDYQFWKSEREHGIRDGATLDPIGQPPFQIASNDKVVTAGSCFAQHVGRYISQSGLTHYVTEPAHPVIPLNVAMAHNYGLFSARYGNVYTARQLKQLLQRAYGIFTPLQSSWVGQNGGVVDPFRPQIQPGDFLNEAELLRDRAHHFARLRRAISEMDVFVFTLGLTEAWRDLRDGAIYPLAPGVAGGVYDPTQVGFVNFDETETYNDLRDALEFIRSKNANVRIILTVSPVPLNATFEDKHVLISTTWSKAILRIAAEKAVRHFDDCVYFPSYEIITSPHVRGQYYAEDCRNVTQEGVNRVMRLFLKHYAGIDLPNTQAKETSPKTDKHLADMTEKIRVLCDEEAIDNS